MPPGRIAEQAASGSSQRRGGPRFRIRGRGKPGARRSRSAGAGEGEGGESMPDAEASPLLPDEAPAENSIEGKPLRRKTPARQDAGPPHRECRVRSRHPRAGGFIYVIDGGHSPGSAAACGNCAE